MRYDRINETVANGRVYMAVFWLAEAQDIPIGKLGQFRFQQGYYLYAGSAGFRGLRLPLRWAFVSCTETALISAAQCFSQDIEQLASGQFDRIAFHAAGSLRLLHGNR